MECLWQQPQWYTILPSLNHSLLLILLFGAQGLTPVLTPLNYSNCYLCLGDKVHLDMFRVYSCLWIQGSPMPKPRNHWWWWCLNMGQQEPYLLYLLSGPSLQCCLTRWILLISVINVNKWCQILVQKKCMWGDTETFKY